MADKMMRIAGRDSEGKAKAIKTDNEGNLSTRVVDLENNNSISRYFMESGLFNRKDIYFYGKEHFVFSGFNGVGNFSYAKNNDHLKLSLMDNPSEQASISYLTDTPIINRGERYNSLVVEYDVVGHTQYNTDLRFHVRNSTKPEDATVGRVEHIQLKSPNGERRISKIDLSSLPDESYYLDLRIMDPSTYVSVDADLNIYNVYMLKEKQIGGGMQAIDKDTNERIELSAIRDEGGKSVLRVVDAAPFAYDEKTDTLKVSMDMSQTGKADVETVFDGAVNAGSDANFQVSFNNEKEIWFAVSFNQSDWSLQGGGVFSPESNYSNILFPKRDAESKSYNDVTPAVSLFLPMAPHPNMGLTEPTTLEEAKRYQTQMTNQTIAFRFQNKSAENGNAKIKILRVW